MENPNREKTDVWNKISDALEKMTSHGGVLYLRWYDERGRMIKEHKYTLEIHKNKNPKKNYLKFWDTITEWTGRGYLSYPTGVHEDYVETRKLAPFPSYVGEGWGYPYDGEDERREILNELFDERIEYYLEQIATSIESESGYDEVEYEEVIA